MKRLLWIAVFALTLTSCLNAAKPEKVILGDEQFDLYLPMIEGKRVAVFSNHSGIVGDKVSGSKLADALKETNGCFTGNGQDDISMIPFLEPSVSGGSVEYGPHLVDVLLDKGVDVRAIFSPEHGFRGNADAGEHVGSSIDEQTGVEILSLYEANGSRIPSKEKMDKFDVLLVDIQDVGLRYYTYYVTMHHLMEACAKYDKMMIVLDRPNPNGFYVDGTILDMKYKSGIGWLPIATVHGMTLGELALMVNGEGWLENGTCPLEVIPCRNYTHNTRYSLILPPSPNLKDMKSVYLYSSTCYFEGSIATAGRGTEFSFEVFGHPEINPAVFDFSFTPRSIPGAKNPRYLNEVCYGRDLRKIPLETIWSEKINLKYIVEAYTDLQKGDAFFGTNNHFELLAGAGWVRDMIENGADAEEISDKWQGDTESFIKQREPYLLYPLK